MCVYNGKGFAAMPLQFFTLLSVGTTCVVAFFPGLGTAQKDLCNQNFAERH